MVTFDKARRWISHKLASKAVILHYHRIVNVPQDPHLLCVKPENFAEQLTILQHDTHPAPLQQVAQAIRDGYHPHRAVVLTFDDGYVDNLYNAEPLLKKYGLPATFFITTGYLGGGREFWWDELERLLLLPDKLPAVLDLRINGSDFHWVFDKTVDSQADDGQRQREWNMSRPVDPGTRQHLFRSVWERLHVLSEDDRCRVLEALAAWVGSAPKVRETHRPLFPDEVLRLSAEPLIEIGAHTVSHPVLSSLPTSKQREEIQGSKTHLEKLLGHRVSSFSYPHGQQSDYTSETVAIVQDAGFDYACSSLPGAVWHGSDSYQLPRIVVRDWDGDEFSRRLRSFFQM